MQFRSPQPLLTGAIGLAIGLTIAIAITPQTATGYPTAAVSTGINPVVSTGGSIMGSVGSATAITAPADQDLVITDIVLGVTNTYSYDCEGNFVVEASSAGTPLGQFAVGHPNLDQAQLRSEVISLRSGLRVAAGASLDLTLSAPYRACGDLHTLHYTISGYHAQP